MKEYKPRKITKPEKPSWYERYGCYSFIKGPLSATFSYQENGYRIRVLNRECEYQPTDIREAKILAMRAMVDLGNMIIEAAERELVKLRKEFPEIFDKLAKEKRKWKRI